MFYALQLLCVLLVAAGMGLSLAHALEYPGKLRLDEEKYLVVQTIYYPGFTIGGMVGEFGAMLATLVLLFVTPYGSTAFTLTLIAFLLLAAAHAVFWLVNQPANKVWLAKQQLAGAGEAFFSAGGTLAAGTDWRVARERWEYGHIIRAALFFLSLAVLTGAVATT
jgi:hypothetical protein